AIEAFHILAYGQGLADPHLPRLSRDPRTRVGAPQPAPLPPVPVRPTPASRSEFVPESLSASRHQHLIDCPYQFFAADCLRLSPQEEVREALEKADYGELVHTCLQAFHQKVGKLPGPFAGPLDPDRRAEAIDLLTQISQAVFRQHLEDNFEHRGWLHRWLAHVPGYVDWQLKRATAWQVEDCERRANRPVGGFELTGRLDRIDAGEDGVAVVDYKTGAVPSRGEVETGEAVQLPSYALLLDHVARVEYLQVEAARNLALEGEALETLSAAVESRLKRMREQLEDGAALPAWGDADTCARCDFRGVCRRPAWGD
ncbi:MAG: PD-(D/E)XK nuclease family protein, partial [Gammaproteobacteria bacterium]